MKTGFIKIVSGIFLLVMVACNNEKTEETKTVTPTTTPAPSTPAPVKVEPKTDISVGPGGAEVKTKDVNVKFDTKDTTKN